MFNIQDLKIGDIVEMYEPYSDPYPNRWFLYRFKEIPEAHQDNFYVVEGWNMYKNMKETVFTAPGSFYLESRMFVVIRDGEQIFPTEDMEQPPKTKVVFF